MSLTVRGEKGVLKASLKTQGSQLKAAALEPWGGFGSRRGRGGKEQTVDTELQLTEQERFGEVIASSRLQARHPITGSAKGGKNQHGEGLPSLTQTVQHLQPVLFGEQLVQDEQVGLVGFEGLGKLTGMVKGPQQPTHLLALAGEESAHFLVVVEDPKIDRLLRCGGGCHGIAKTCRLDKDSE
jgi:hypothetical protein